MRRLTPLFVTLYIAAAVACLLLVTAGAVLERSVRSVAGGRSEATPPDARLGRVGMRRLSDGLREVGT